MTAPGRPLDLLLVEDSADDARLVERELRQGGFTLRRFVRVETPGAMAEALEYLRGPSPRPLVVLLDLNMPRMDGHEVLRRIRADPRTRHLPVVVLTSSAEDEDVLRSYDAGANSYVRKPVSFLSFVEAARQLGVYWLQLNRPAPQAGGPLR